MRREKPYDFLSRPPASPGPGMAEAQAPLYHPADMPDDAELTDAEWDDAKAQAMQAFAAMMLDTPENHLAYIRRQTLAVISRHV